MSNPALLRAPDVAPQDQHAEENVLGAVLLAPNTLDTLATSLRLAPEHFYREQYAEIYRAMLELAARGQGVDTETVWYELHKRGTHHAIGGKATIELLSTSVPAVGNYKQYAQRVIELAEWRARLNGAYQQLVAIAELNEDAYQDATRRDELAGAGHDGLLTPESLGSEWMDWMDADDSNAIPTPWPKINAGLFGGLRPGDTTVLAGHSGMGKTTAGDQILEHAKDTRNLSTCAYLNEMSAIDRTSRLLAGRAGVSFRKIMEKKVSPEEAKRLLRAAPDLPFAMQPCSGWSVDAIARSIRKHKWGVAFVDLATRIPARLTADWDYISGALADAARQSGTHVILAVQLNRERATGAERPMPVLRDLRNTGAWEQDARNVLFVHRREEIDRDTGIPTVFDDGVIQVAKVSNGMQGAAQRVYLDYAAMKFKPLAETTTSTRERDPFE